ncbi:uncharacterized protein [Atheta coriaria]|uniref:uncharacterized protein n=1 Tax=Dalotia coriaria TaxID=877792 RepID=UPI0031F39DCB
MSLSLYITVLITLIFFIKFGDSIDCFKCISINRDNPSCDDPFHNNFSVKFFEAPCMGGRKGRDGLYPATSCVKINGKFENGTSLTIRSCELDSGTLTTDTELIRMSHCGGFVYGGQYVRGCVQSCNDADGCNRATMAISSNVFYPTIISVLSVIIYIMC